MTHPPEGALYPFYLGGTPPSAPGVRSQQLTGPPLAPSRDLVDPGAASMMAGILVHPADQTKVLIRHPRRLARGVD